MTCEACHRDDHAHCGLQTWCECPCDPDAFDYVVWCVFCNGNYLTGHDDDCLYWDPDDKNDPSIPKPGM